MYILGVISLVILSFAITDWHARGVFVAIAYPRKYGHGKSWKRAKNHYKTNWSAVERFFWIPIFKEYYDRKYRCIAYLSYIHILLGCLTICNLLINEFVFLRFTFWHYAFIAFSVFTLLRLVYDDAIGKEKL